jgi:hypothetical protein
MEHPDWTAQLVGALALTVASMLAGCTPPQPLPSASADPPAFCHAILAAIADGDPERAAQILFASSRAPSPSERDRLKLAAVFKMESDMVRLKSDGAAVTLVETQPTEPVDEVTIVIERWQARGGSSDIFLACAVFPTEDGGHKANFWVDDNRDSLWRGVRDFLAANPRPRLGLAPAQSDARARTVAIALPPAAWPSSPAAPLSGHHR